MSARRDPIHSKRVRQRIKTGLLVKRLEENALAEEPIMTRDQIECAKYLVNQSMGAPATTVMHGDMDGNPLAFTMVDNFVSSSEGREDGRDSDTGEAPLSH